MLKKRPLVGNRRCTRQFTFDEVDTEDGFSARFRFVYKVEVYRGKSWILPNGKCSSSGWIFDGFFSNEDAANASINMKVLQEAEQRKYIDNNPANQTVGAYNPYVNTPLSPSWGIAPSNTGWQVTLSKDTSKTETI